MYDEPAEKEFKVIARAIWAAPPHELIHVAHFVAYHEETEPVDDAVIVCIDWTGRDDGGGRGPGGDLEISVEA